MSHGAPTDTPESPGVLQRRLAELGTLYEVARGLIGTRDQAQVASRVVLSVMGALGVRSGALLAMDDRGRYGVLYAEIEWSEEPPPLAVPAHAREWMLRNGAFALRTAGARTALGDLHDRFVGEFDAVFGVAVPDTSGLAAFLLFGPRLIPSEYAEADLALLDSLGALTAQALEAHRGRAGEAAKRRRATRQARNMAVLRTEHPAFESMIGESAALLGTCQSLLLAAGTRFPVLLTGETGVGKELAARAIHDLSERASGPFEVVDCGSIPRELIESEIFGHVRGAFTGAHKDRRGAFEIAHRGTLFLDEIGEMPLQLQTRLLRVIQEGRVRRVGDERAIDVDVRVVAATNRNLQGEVSARRFREDLYYRLNVFAVNIPPLRDRTGDLEPLVRHFLDCQTRGGSHWEIDPEFWAALAAYPWPGNIRELSNLCSALAAHVRDRDRIDLEDVANVWRLQHVGEEPPWSGRPLERRGQLGTWVLDEVRKAHFNLVEAEGLLKRRSRAGQPVPVKERSALAYYVTGEILRALVDAAGNEALAAAAIAGDEVQIRRVIPRVAKVCEALRAVHGGDGDLHRHFAKLPAGYKADLEGAYRLVTRG